MPEIKHNFTGGKMNKDLDERLVPKGQYRDAMNVQVSTSEGSNVGAVQNILGNKAIDLPIVQDWGQPANSLHPIGTKPQKYDCVGSIADEKNDDSYWFLVGETHSHQEIFDGILQAYPDPTPNPSEFTVRDYIIKVTKNNSIPVFTDRKRFYCVSEPPAPFGSTLPQPLQYKKILIPLGFIDNLSVGDVLINILGYHADGVKIMPTNSTIVYVDKTAAKPFIVLDTAWGYSSWMGSLQSMPFVLEFSSRCLEFDHNNLITSINVVDDLLFWTDGLHEPKVINIDRSIDGTDFTGIISTKLINPSLSLLPLRNMLPKDVRVIKRKPTQKLTVEYSRNIRSGITSATADYNFNTSYGLFSAGYQGEIDIFSITGNPDELNYQVGDVLLFLNQNDIETGNRTLPHEQDVKLVIENITFNSINGMHRILYKIISISSLTPSSLSTFSVVLDERSFEKFENEMVRFSYRYKYLDKEVSAFAPFTELIFSPSEFFYTKDTAYNIGMKNNITEVKLKDFIDLDNTQSIQSVDLLVKFEGSPLVYVIDTLKRNEFPINSSSLTGPYDGEYDFNPKNIKGVLPENQMLRPWDAVPRTARSQEIIGNRIVYGNYLSSYTFDAANSFSLNVSNSIRPLYEEVAPLVGKPSIKSKRNYQVGIVLVDEHGRESPIFSNNNSSIEIPKSSSKDSTSLVVQNNSTIPSWAKSYKYYIKDSSLPAYNIVVDAFYKAENGDFWISVPSSERNKIEEGDFLELKKGIDSNESVEQIQNTKAISIKNEVPEFIGTTWRSIGKALAEYTSGTTTYKLFQYSSDMPQKGKRAFKISKAVWMKQHADQVDPDTGVHTGLGGGATLDREGLNDLSVIFSTNYDSTSSYLGGINKSRHYSCGRITVDDPVAGNTSLINYHITLDEPIREEDDWLVTSPQDITPNLVVEIFEKTRLPRPQFQGKFFVKIEAREDLQSSMAASSSSFNISETKLHEVPVYNFAEYLGGNQSKLGSIANPNDGTVGYNVDGNTTLQGPTNITSITMDTYDEWEEVFRYKAATTGAMPTYWFVDRLQYYRQAKEVTGEGIFTNLAPNSAWVDSSGASPYPYNPPSYNQTHKRYGLGVFVSNPHHIISFPETDIVEPHGERVPFYAYEDLFFIPNGYYGSAPLGVGNPSGFINNEGKFYMELSLIGLFEEMDISYVSTIDEFYGGSYQSRIGSGVDSDHWKVNKTAEASGTWPYNSNPIIDLDSDNQKTLDYLKTTDQKFKFEGGTEVFTIKSCHLEWRYNYTDGQAALVEQEKKENGQPYTQAIIDEFIDPLNRRLTAIIEIDKDPLGYTDNTGSIIDITNSNQANTYESLKIIFLEQTIEISSNTGLSTDNPAVFEAEKKEENNLDIYYEASDEIPVELNISTMKRFIPIGSKIIYPKDPSFLLDTTVSDYRVEYFQNSNLSIVMENCPGSIAAVDTFNNMVTNGDKLAFVTPSGNTIYLKVLGANVFGFIRRVWVSTSTTGGDCNISLNWYNCIAFGNGVESVYLKDSFNKSFINKGVKVSSTLQGEYKEERKTNGLIYSGLYNENSETNNLNQFIMAEKITKEINPTYGSIQKLHARSTADGDLITLCEDRVLKILANKDALYNADGNPQLTATDNVLGQAIPYSGEYGISTNPESFASESYRCYFTDKIRGVVLRLSKDGLTPISDFGMKDWFRDHLKLSKRLIGSYDSYKKEYNITLNQDPNLLEPGVIEGLGTSLFTLSFQENVKGWVSFKSFALMQNGLSFVNDYYTYYDNNVWMHHINDGIIHRNTFYNTFRDSTINVILNDSPGTIKTFHTINYEGSQGAYEDLKSYETFDAGTTVVNGTYPVLDHVSLYPKVGWIARNLKTDKEEGQIQGFVEKEGKWFNYIHGKESVSASDFYVTGGFDNADSAFQGIASILGTPISSGIYGCTDPDAENYDSNATFEFTPSNCIRAIYGCMDSTAPNYAGPGNTNGVNPPANMDDGSCEYHGCTDPTAINYNSDANMDDGSCIPTVYGCMDSAAFNYSGPPSGNANTDDGSCIAIDYGCTDPTAENYDPNANTANPSYPCIYGIYGCMDPSSINYYSQANIDDNTCYNYDCNDNNAVNHDPTSTVTTDCLYCYGVDVASVQVTHSYNPQFDANNDPLPGNDSTIYISWDAPTQTDMASVFSYVVYGSPLDGSGDPILDSFGQWDIDNWPIQHAAGGVNATLPIPTSAQLNGLNSNTEYVFVIRVNCWSGIGVLTNALINSGNYNFKVTVDLNIYSSYTIGELITGCTNEFAFNWDSNANFDDGSCVAVTIGCTDPLATNYDASANVDDGSCIDVVNGCTDPTASNYDSNANVDDGSCVPYFGGWIPPVIPADANFDSNVNNSDNTLMNNHIFSNRQPTTLQNNTGNITGHNNYVGVLDKNLLDIYFDSQSPMAVDPYTNHSSGMPYYIDNPYFDGLVLKQIETLGIEEVDCGDFSCLTPNNSWTTGANDVPNGGIASTINISNNGAEFVVNNGNYVVLYQNITFIDGKEYILTFDLTSDGSSNGITVRDTNSGDALNENIILTDYSTTQTYTTTFTASAQSTKIYFKRWTGGAGVNYNFTINNVSIKQNKLPNHNCYRLYAQFTDPNTSLPYTNMALTHMFAESAASGRVLPLKFDTSSTWFNSDVFGAHQNNQSEVNIGAWFMFPENEFDTWLTIGDNYTDNVIQFGNSGLPDNNFANSLTEINNEFSLHRGNVDSTPTYVVPDSDGRVLLGQFSTSGTISLQVNLAGWIKDVNGDWPTEIHPWEVTGINSYTLELL